MKTLLNVIGALALLAGIGAWLLGTTAVQSIQGSMSMLIAVTSIGLAKVIELLEAGNAQAVKAAKEQRTLQLDLLPAEMKPPEPPAKQKYYVLVNEQTTGPMTAAQVQALFKKESITSTTLVIREGDRDWLEYQSVFAP